MQNGCFLNSCTFTPKPLENTKRKHLLKAQGQFSQKMKAFV